MSRTIKFRVRVGTTWCYFDIKETWPRPEGVSEFEGDIDWDTLGEFCGLTDKNGREIYEGDVINFYWPDYSAHFEAREVFYHVDAFCVKRDKDIILLSDVTEREIIGNIYENPELLNEKEV
jgi:uncharacterized phage protein (TIGR01671 family)